VVDDVEETRDLLESLLRESGYEVLSARNEEDIRLKSRRRNLDLILIGIGSPVSKSIELGERMRLAAGVQENVAIVIFCCPEIEEGSEVHLAGNVHLTRLDNFDQLRQLLFRLLDIGYSAQ